jgi:hypothetical protein
VNLIVKIGLVLHRIYTNKTKPSLIEPNAASTNPLKNIPGSPVPHGRNPMLYPFELRALALTS